MNWIYFCKKGHSARMRRRLKTKKKKKSRHPEGRLTRRSSHERALQCVGSANASSSSRRVRSTWIASHSGAWCADHSRWMRSTTGVVTTSTRRWSKTEPKFAKRTKVGSGQRVEKTTFRSGEPRRGEQPVDAGLNALEAFFQRGGRQEVDTDGERLPCASDESTHFGSQPSWRQLWWKGIHRQMRQIRLDNAVARSKRERDWAEAEAAAFPNLD